MIPEAVKMKFFVVRPASSGLVGDLSDPRRQNA